MSVTATPASPPATVPASSVIPFPTAWGGAAALAGCCSGGGLEALNKCYWEVQQAMNFLSALMIDLMNNDAGVQAAMIAGITKSGLPLPTAGVTSGVAATPGQVGEVVKLTMAGLPYSAVYSTQLVPLGILQPGDYVIWLSVDTLTTAATVVTGVLAPLPAGFDAINLGGQGPTQGTCIVSKPGQALISVATSVQAQIGVQGSAAGTCNCNLFALRVR